MTTDPKTAWSAEQFRAALRTASLWLDQNVARINALNVFPVPDGDTGTNMSLTMRAALQEAGDKPFASVAELARIIAHGALMGARGNSGVILSQILRGFARSLDSKPVLGAVDLADALKEGAATAYKGVMKPVEGTILTVARESADAAARQAATGGQLDDTIAAALDEARASLARTPSLLPVLKEAGVVDAGGEGYTIILEGVSRHLAGEPVGAAGVQVQGPAEQVHAPEGRYNYDTQFIIKGSDLDVEAIREQVAALGDSVLVVGDQHTVKVHVHVDRPGEVLNLGVHHGQVSDVVIENMQAQYEAFKAQGAASASAPQTAPTPTLPPAALVAAEPLGDIAVIAVASGEGLQRVFGSLGVSATVPGGQTMNPSTQDLLQAIESVSRGQVVVLPNNSNIILTAEQARGLSRKQVTVVPTRTVPQGIAALLAFNYQADLAANAELMLAAAKHVQTGEITTAVRSVQVNGLKVCAGQIIGLLNDQLTTVGDSTQDVAHELLRRMGAAEREIVTVYYGRDVSANEGESLAESIRLEYPELEVELLDGGQPHYYYIISAE